MRNKTYRILSKDVKMSNDTWKTGLNNNDMIIGTSGTGKTRGYVIPNILNCDNESIIVADTKGSLYNMLAKSMKKKGYKIINIDFTDCLQSDGYNPLFDQEKCISALLCSQSHNSKACMAIPNRKRY